MKQNQNRGQKNTGLNKAANQPRARASAAASAPPSGGTSAASPSLTVEADLKLRSLEEPIYMATGLVTLLGGGWAAARGNEKDPSGTSALSGGGLNAFAEALAEDVHRSWDKAHAAVLSGEGEGDACATLRLHLQEAAAFCHAGCHALATEQALTGSTDFQRMNSAYRSLAERMTRYFLVFHDEVPVFPYEPKVVVKPEVAA